MWTIEKVSDEVGHTKKNLFLLTFKISRFIGLFVSILIILLRSFATRAGSLNQSAATASSEPILKGGHLVAIFKRKIAVVSRNTYETPTDSVAVVTYRFQWASSVSCPPMPFFF